METPFFTRGQQVRVVRKGVLYWEASAIIKSFTYDPTAKGIEILFSAWRGTDGSIEYPDGDNVEISCAPDCIQNVELAATGLFKYVTRSNESYFISQMH